MDAVDGEAHQLARRFAVLRARSLTGPPSLLDLVEFAALLARDTSVLLAHVRRG